METIDDLLQYFEREAIKKADKGFMSERIRRFVRQYYTETRNARVVVGALYKTYQTVAGEDVKESYFRNVIKKAWTTEIDEAGIEWVDLNKQKKLRLRKRKA